MGGIVIGADDRAAPGSSLDTATREELINLLAPLMGAESERRALLTLALGSEAPVLRRLQFGGAVEPFIVNMINDLMAFGEMAPGRSALWALLEVVRERVGVDRQARIDALRSVINVSPNLATVEPHFDDEHRRALSEALEAAFLRKAERISAGQDTTEVQQEILSLKRRLREGPQLKAGDFLLDGRFRLLERLGSGGFATIWKGYDRQRHELVALKVLHSQYAEDRTRRERFFRGAKQMARLHHPGIVRVLAEELADEGYYFFVMEYLGGGDFHQAVLQDRIPVAERLAVIAAVGEALQYAHEQGVIHRDIKPANIILDRQGRPRLTDFDLVRALDTTGGTRTGMLGTWIYAAPEAMDKPQEVRPPADVYSLAMTVVFALYGQDLPNAVFRDASAFVDMLNISPALKGVLQRALAWEWPERYASVAEFCQALASPPPKYEPYRTFRDAFQDGSAAPEMVYLPGGTFKMGDVQGKGRDNERPVHEVTVDAFAIGRYPVTVGEFRRFVEAKGYQTEAEREGGAYVYGKEWWRQKPDANWRNPYFPQDDQHPVVCLSWSDAIAYCEWLSEQTGERYWLPTEAQWEYACRASSEAAYCFGDDAGRLEEYAWYSKNSERKTHPVGQKRANAWGLYDVHGNVWEWVQDWYGSYSKEPQSNPSGPETGSARVVRGGSWLHDADRCRSAVRNDADPGHRISNLGFRLARQL